MRYFWSFYVVLFGAMCLYFIISSSIQLRSYDVQKDHAEQNREVVFYRNIDIIKDNIICVNFSTYLNYTKGFRASTLEIETKRGSKVCCFYDESCQNDFINTYEQSLQEVYFDNRDPKGSWSYNSPSYKYYAQSLAILIVFSVFLVIELIIFIYWIYREFFRSPPLLEPY